MDQGGNSVFPAQAVRAIDWCQPAAEKMKLDCGVMPWKGMIGCFQCDAAPILEPCSAAKRCINIGAPLHVALSAGRSLSLLASLSHVQQLAFINCMIIMHYVVCGPCTAHL
jgi:hypothetical protein